jgi:hypothetical protein
MRRPEGYIGFLDEKPNHRSSTRLMSMLSLMASIGFGFAGILKPESAQTAVQLSVTFLTGSVAGKGINKFAEHPEEGEYAAKH